MEDIEAGLVALAREVRDRRIGSIAIPPLGCGLGGLPWEVVRPLIEQTFEALPGVRVLLYEPHGAPKATAMVNRAKCPRMTAGRAALLGLMRRYLAALMDDSVTLLELHKLMYFMQEAGEPLRLKYAKAPYGPYAENLRHVLNAVEGHFIIGYGDGEDAPAKPIELLPAAADRAETFLADHPTTRQRFDRVVDVISGFETPYGMELLSTVHWVAAHEKAATPDDAVAATYRWNQRKRMFSREHLRLAWETLDEAGWLS